MEWETRQFGERLQRLRLAKGLSMLAFGRSIGTSASRIKDWETGRNAPGASWVAKISITYGVSADELLLGVQAEQRPPMGSAAEGPPPLSKMAEMPTLEEMRFLIRRENKKLYSGKDGRKRAEDELVQIGQQLKKRDLLELVELAKWKLAANQD